VLAFSWCRHKVGRSVYARSSKGGYLHRLVAGLERGDGLEVDHKDGNGLDCRRSNLRVVTHAQNQQNRHQQANRTSKYRGVTYSQTRVRNARAPWVARVKVGGTTHLAGYFWDEAQAGRAAAALRREFMPYATT
jgi:hypothetical protein